MTRPPARELRSGWTTGACATAAASAAFEALITGVFPDPVVIRLPKGQRPGFALAWHRFDPDVERATAAVIKDAGDDPDVTHEAEIVASVRRLTKGKGIVFKAGEGVGMVTKPGLPIPPGEPAINPVPRAMITEAVRAIAHRYDTLADAEITISVPRGEALAKKTWNPRLGIVGGISILGTTGIVKPYSCSAWIASIHRGVDVCRANDIHHAVACTGSTSEAAMRSLLQLPEIAYLDMGDFVGGLLKYLRRHPIDRVTIAGGFGKMSKLANGYLDLHSGRSQVDLDFLAQALQRLGAGHDAVLAARQANSALAVLEIARRENLALSDDIAVQCRKTAQEMVGLETKIDIFIVGRSGEILSHAP